jgi:hypothetical protein
MPVPTAPCSSSQQKGFGKRPDRLVSRHNPAELTLVATFLEELDGTMAAAIEESRVRPAEE